MRRMYTTQGIKKLIDEEIDESFENLEDRKGVFEKIADKDGHLRFIEGSIATNEIDGVTYKYNKWSLSGTHLMIVLAFDIEGGKTINAGTIFGSTSLPSWVYNKVSTITGSVVMYKNTLARDVGGSPAFSEITMTLLKGNNLLPIENEVVLDASALTSKNVRIQFDLLIDNA